MANATAIIHWSSVFSCSFPHHPQLTPRLCSLLCDSPSGRRVCEGVPAPSAPSLSAGLVSWLLVSFSVIDAKTTRRSLVLRHGGREASEKSSSAGKRAFSSALPHRLQKQVRDCKVMSDDNLPDIQPLAQPATFQWLVV